MTEFHTYTDSLPWWTAGILLGLVQVLAVSLAGPLDVSSQFIIADTIALENLAPEYIKNHPIKEHEEYNISSYGLWLSIGILAGAFFSTVHLRRWRIRTTTVIWQQNYKVPIVLRLIVTLCGGFLMLLGAGFAFGGVCGQFISGWSQLSLSVVPFTITMFLSGMLVAKLVYPKNVNEGKKI